MNSKYAHLVIVFIVFFFVAASGLLLFTDHVKAPEKYIYMLLIAPVSWLAIKWLPVKNRDGT